MRFEERALRFACHDEALYGVACIPESPSMRGVLIVVGGPQYRVGSHRQFTLLARALAAQGIPAMRFDYRGMGDSDGPARSFEQVDDDLRAAIDAFQAALPAVREVVLWGLCDGACAALFYAPQDARVAALVLLNPWVRTEQGLAKATLKHYYRGRLAEPDLWRRMLRGQFNFARAAGSALALVRSAVVRVPARAGAPVALPERMLAAAGQFTRPLLIVLSGADLTAREFADMAAASPAWRRLLDAPRVTRHTLDGADHTFSRRVWRDQVARWTAEWVAAL
ncbi:MAG: hydrolase 1, exosortase A system-associated [Pseudomonadota bacterium]